VVGAAGVVEVFAMTRSVKTLFDIQLLNLLGSVRLVRALVVGQGRLEYFKDE